MSFNIGASAVAGPAKMDMALDDIIKTTRKAAPRRKPAGNKNPNALAAKATGQNKAKRAVGAAARRGLKGAMEVDKQVQRASNGGGNRGAGVPRGRGARITAPSPASVRAKARALAGVKAPRDGGGVAITAPTQQAIGAAARAMKDFGFKVPKGMQMQISFVSKPTTNTPPKAPVFKAPMNGGHGGGGNKGRGGGRGAGRGGIRRNMTPR